MISTHRLQCLYWTQANKDLRRRLNGFTANRMKQFGRIIRPKAFVYLVFEKRKFATRIIKTGSLQHANQEFFIGLATMVYEP